MSLVASDVVESSTIVEENGYISEAVRHIVVSGVSGDTLAEIAANALAADGVPLPNTALDEIDFRYRSMRLERRVPRVLVKNDDGYTVSIECTYRVKPLGLVQGNDPGASGPIYGEGSSNQNTVEVEVWRDNKTPITVKYGTDSQQAKITIADTATTCRRQCVWAVEDPDAITGFWVNKVNKTNWKQYATIGDDGAIVLKPCEPHTWLVKSVSYRAVDISVWPNVFEFTFEFEYKKEIIVNENGTHKTGGHRFIVVHQTKNEETGEMEMSDAVEYGNNSAVSSAGDFGVNTTGKIIIDYYEEAEFNLIFRY